MHWTALLAYRRIPANSMVIGDVGCIHCGYNLRGLRVAGNCPECGSSVRDSLIVLAKPELVTQSLRGFANSYLTLLLLALGCVSGMTGWPALVSTTVIFAGALYRLWSAGELRFRAQLQNSNMLHDRSRWLWYAAVVECLVALGWAVSVAVLTSLILQSRLIGLSLVCIGYGWLLMTLISAITSGLFGLALARMLGYEWMVIEFRVQIGAAIGCMLILPWPIVASVGTAPSALGVFTFGILGLALFATLGLTWVAIHQVANAAERVSGTVDDLLDSGQLAAADIQVSSEPDIQIDPPASPTGSAAKSNSTRLRRPGADYRP
jgi:hypothetical protein